MYFWYPLRYRVIQYLIRKLSDMVKMDQEGLIVAAFFNISHGILNIEDLLHKQRLVETQFLRTVIIKTKKITYLSSFIGLLPFLKMCVRLYFCARQNNKYTIFDREVFMRSLCLMFFCHWMFRMANLLNKSEKNFSYTTKKIKMTCLNWTFCNSNKFLNP